MHCLLMFYWKNIICAQKLNQMCQKTQLFDILKNDNSDMCTLHLFRVFIFMVDNFKNFDVGQKMFLTEI